MAVPSCDPGDLLIADRTEAVLFYPQMAEPPFSLQPCCHMDVQAFFKIRFPGRVVGVGLCSNLRVSLDADRRSCQQSDLYWLLETSVCAASALVRYPLKGRRLRAIEPCRTPALPYVERQGGNEHGGEAETFEDV